MAVTADLVFIHTREYAMLYAFGKRRLLVVMGLLAAGMAGSGCFLLLLGAGAAAGAGTVAYVKGELRSIETVDQDKAVEAAKQVLDDMGYLIERESAESGKKIIKGRGTVKQNGETRKREITVSVQSVSQTECEIRIRVDIFGNEAVSRNVLEKMKAKF
ncbi:MAG: hypothetical protein Kow0059_10240 [Candidatus Sumerlaeia bacterium]